MGNTLASAFDDRAKALQKKNAEEMKKIQMETSMEAQETQRKMNVALEIAAAREKFKWWAGTYVLAASGLTINAIRNPPLPPLALVFIPATIWMAYQYDFAYGNQSDRINNTVDAILAKKFEKSTPKAKDKE